MTTALKDIPQQEFQKATHLTHTSQLYSPFRRPKFCADEGPSLTVQ